MTYKEIGSILNRSRSAVSCRVNKILYLIKEESLIGKRFNRLTVLNKSHKRSGNHIMWECVCECGNIKIIDGQHLKTGKIKSCGCLHNQLARQRRLKNLLNKRFGKLLVVSKMNYVDKYKNILWKCMCDCGNIKIVNTHSLNSGNTKSCGCLRKQHNRKKDLTGKRFGMLLVLKESNKRKSNRITWYCKCDCGKYKNITSDMLIGGVLSCGCLLISKNEAKIQNILEFHKILFIKQKTFRQCKNKRLLKFDFYLPNYNLCIEYQGEQHYQNIKRFGGTREFIKRKNRDDIKRLFCYNEHIDLLEIPYWNSDNIEEIILKKLKLSRSYDSVVENMKKNES